MESLFKFTFMEEILSKQQYITHEYIICITTNVRCFSCLATLSQLMYVVNNALARTVTKLCACYVYV